MNPKIQMTLAAVISGILSGSVVALVGGKQEQIELVADADLPPPVEIVGAAKGGLADKVAGTLSDRAFSCSRPRHDPTSAHLDGQLWCDDGAGSAFYVDPADYTALKGELGAGDGDDVVLAVVGSSVYASKREAAAKAEAALEAVE